MRNVPSKDRCRIRTKSNVKFNDGVAPERWCLMVDQLYTVQEVMGIFKVGDETIYRWIRQGKIKAIKIGQGWRIKSDSLQELSQGALK